VDREQARKRAWDTYKELRRISERDPEQEVQGLAVPVLDAVLKACAAHVPEDPAVARLDDLMSPAVFETGSLRAVDLAVVTHQLAQALGPSRRAYFLE
jgi:hypothetical protein